jgi:hypothetical protein
MNFPCREKQNIRTVSKQSNLIYNEKKHVKVFNVENLILPKHGSKQ